MTSKFTELAIDCADPVSLARFWCAVLGYEVLEEDDDLVMIGSPLVPEGRARSGPVPPSLTFVRVPEGKTVKNRLHIDINPGRPGAGRGGSAPARAGCQAGRRWPGRRRELGRAGRPGGKRVLRPGRAPPVSAPVPPMPLGSGLARPGRLL